MAQVILENIYKSFPPRSGEKVTHKSQTSLDSEERLDIINVLRRINLTIADGEFMVLVLLVVGKAPYCG